MRRALPLWFTLGCGSTVGDFSTADATADADSGADTFDSDTATTSGTTGDDAVWWSFDAVVPVSGGAAQVAGATLRVSLWTAQLELLCRHQVPVTDIVDAPAPASGALAFWRWETDSGTPETTPCPSWPGRTLWMGLGPYDPRLDPAVLEHGWDDIAGYSLLIGEVEDGPVFLVGIAGTEEQWDGTAEPVTKAPIADGTYEAHAVYLLAVP